MLLLRRVYHAGKADGFRYAELFVADGSKLLASLDGGINAGFIERVNVGMGQWYYRLTDAGKAAVAAKRVRSRKAVKKKE